MRTALGIAGVIVALFGLLFTLQGFGAVQGSPVALKVPPGAAWLVLFVAPLPGIFVAAGIGLVASWAVAGRLHPRLGVLRPSRGGA